MFNKGFISRSKKKKNSTPTLDGKGALTGTGLGCKKRQKQLNETKPLYH